MDGDEGLIPCDIKKALYRIICEGAGNAIRHGKCTYLNVSMEVEDEKIKVNICDNGVGFDIEKVMKDKNTGLGVYNMKTLSKHYNGKCTIRSEVNNGTTIRVEIPITNTLPNVLSKVGEMIVS
ncbi:Oxygen sensor histidine kinase NreB [bioreactor metagenome]|uniref:Oxygen sensor histidine kinase NreB n=1 Tax=bioreactor metagenome TaxID=1076179 RepID=A0A645EGW7_9ZZZZ